MDTSVRVLVANRPRLSRELVLSTLSEQAGIRVVGEAREEQEVHSLVAETKPDFLVIALDEPQKRPALCDVLLLDSVSEPHATQLLEDPMKEPRKLRSWSLAWMKTRKFSYTPCVWASVATFAKKLRRARSSPRSARWGRERPSALPNCAWRYFSKRPGSFIRTR